MARKRISILDGVDEAIGAAADVLEAGGTTIFPTETVYGIGVAAGDSRALEKLRRLKGRDPGKPFQFLVADLAMAKRLGAIFSPKAEKLAANYWPGPMTMVVPDGGGTSTIGVRIPDSEFILGLCRRLDNALVSSSANRAGLPPPLDADAADVFGDDVDLLVDGGGIPDGAPSTVVGCVGDAYEILRRGALGEEAVESAWNE